MSTIETSLSSWSLMTAVNITDSNANFRLDTSSLFIQYLWMIPFSQARHLILPSRFSVDFIANFRLDTSSLFIQYLRMIPFAQSCHLILPSRFSVINIRNFVACLCYWFVTIFTSNGTKHVLSRNSDNKVSNTFPPNFFIPLIRLYVWENIWNNPVDFSIV